MFTFFPSLCATSRLCLAGHPTSALNYALELLGTDMMAKLHWRKNAPIHSLVSIPFDNMLSLICCKRRFLSIAGHYTEARALLPESLDAEFSRVHLCRDHS